MRTLTTLSLSADASIVAFESFASNWGSDQTELNFADIFVHDRTTNMTRKLSVGGGGVPCGSTEL